LKSEITAVLSKRDISTDSDIRLLVDEFYRRVRLDPLLQPVFDDVARVDWMEHLPHLYAFWSDLLFRTRRFTGRPWPKHAVLPVNREHFQRWLSLFRSAVDDNFAGPRATEAKGFAASIADTFQMRMGLLTFSIPAPGTRKQADGTPVGSGGPNSDAER
jgi:hemoglobin